jgi:hypothetical protein
VRWLRYTVIAVLLLVVAAFAAALVLVDPRAIGDALAAQAEASLGEPVAFGEIDLRLFPMPAARLRDLRVGSGETPLLRIEELRVRVSLPALLIGRVVLRSLELERPELQIELDESGAPLLPAAAAGTPGTEPAAAGPAIAITSLRVRDGSVRVGPYRAEGLRVDGSLSLDRSARFELACELPGIGALRALVVEIEDAQADPIVWSIDGRLEEAELEFLRGDVSFAATAGERFEVDLGGAELLVEDVFRKPAGADLRISGTLGQTPSIESLGPFVVALGASELHGRIETSDGAVRIRLQDSSLDVEPITSWFVGEPRPLRGHVRFEDLVLVPEPLSVIGSASLDDLTLALEHGEIQVSGPLRGEGARIVASPLDVRIGGEPSTVDVSYELVSGELDLRSDLADAQVEPLLKALTGQSQLTGTLATRVHVSGPPELARLRGQGTLEITDGELRGVSILEQVLGELAALPLLVARLNDTDLSRYDEREFRRLAASFRLGDGRLQLDDLVVEYRHTTVELRGTVGLEDGELALSGRLLLGQELESELSGRPASRGGRVIPIEGISGTLSSPRVALNRAAVSSALASYASGGRTREKLEETLGKEGADAVEDVLEKLLRGGGR